LLAKHTPQSLMTMEMLENKWIFKHVEQSATLDHYESYGISEIQRIPAYLNSEAVMREMIHDENTGNMIKNDIEMLRVNVGAYISVLAHLDSLNLRNLSKDVQNH